MTRTGLVAFLGALGTSFSASRAEDRVH